MKDQIKYYEVCWAKMDQYIRMMCDIIQEISQTQDLYIHGIPRGGLPIATALTHYIKQSKYIHILNQVMDYNNKIDFENSIVLVVDDVCDSGNTFNKFRETYQEFIYAQNVNVKYMSIHKKLRSTFEPDVYLELLPSDYWIIYPWENIDDVNVDKDYMFI